MELKEYLKKRSLTRTAFAEKVGVTHTHIINIIKGLRYPSRKLAKKIEEVTDGQVPVYELFDIKIPTSKTTDQ